MIIIYLGRSQFKRRQLRRVAGPEDGIIFETFHGELRKVVGKLSQSFFY